MKFDCHTLKTTPHRRPGEATRGFTLVEVLAALLLMAIVVPVALEGLQLASRSGEAAARKVAACRIAERVINEAVVATNYNQGTSQGTTYEDGRAYTWALHNQIWSFDTMRELTADVTYEVRGRRIAVRVATLVPQTQ